MNANNRIPWIVAAAALLFAMIVLVRNEIVPERHDRPVKPDVRPVMQAAEPEWRESLRPAMLTPNTGDYSPWTATERTPAATAQVTPTNTPAPATPSPSPPPTATPRAAHDLQGVVFDGDGNAVSNALVRIVTGEPDRAAERSAVTGKNGRFIIKAIPEEKVDRLIVEADGFSVTMLENLPLPTSADLQIGMSPLAGIDAVVLDYSTTNSQPVFFQGEMQASLMRLQPGGDASNSVLGISEPVLPVDSYLAVRNQKVVVTGGQLRFDNVEPGRYRVSVKTGQKVAESEPLVVRESQRTSATLVLGMKHTVEGNVVAGDSGNAIGQARITLSPATDPGAAPEFPEYLSFTDGGGEFVIPEVQPGRYWMVVGAAGYTTKTLENFQVLPGAAPEKTSVTLSKQEPLITVSVLNAEGRPMAHAPLVLMTTSAPSPKTYFGKTDEAGLHRFDNLMPGRYSLAITAAGDRTRQKTITVALADGEVRELAVRFDRPVPVTGKAVRAGKPYQGVLSFIMRGAAMADNLVKTDSYGGFTTELEPGEYMVSTPEKPGGVLVNISGAESQTINVELP